MFVKSIFQQRQLFYTDVEKLISPGFLSRKVTVNGVRLCMRSLYPSDIFLIRNWADSSYDWKVWTVANSIWMVDGHICLDRHVPPVLSEFLYRLPKPVLNRLFNIELGLFKRTKKAEKALGAYVLEDVSRQKWAFAGKSNPIRDSFLGIQGVESLGPNYVQQVWSAWNQAEDQKEKDLYEWALTKTVVSAQNPKGARKLNAKDKMREEREEKKRQFALDEFYYQARGIIDENGFTLGPDGQPRQVRMKTASTPQELSDEFRRWVAGEDDWHDRIVREYKERIHANMEARKRDQEESIRAMHEEAARLEALQEDKALPLVGYTQDQLKSLLQEQGRTLKPGVRKIHNIPINEKAAAWLKTAPPPQEGDRLVHRGAGPQQGVGGSNNTNLMDQVSNRRPKG